MGPDVSHVAGETQDALLKPYVSTGGSLCEATRTVIGGEVAGTRQGGSQRTHGVREGAALRCAKDLRTREKLGDGRCLSKN